MSATPTAIRTVAAGTDYRARVGSQSLRFIRDTDDPVVWIYSKTRNLGGFDLERFGGELSPAGIRQFFSVS